MSDAQDLITDGAWSPLRARAAGSSRPRNGFRSLVTPARAGRRRTPGRSSLRTNGHPCARGPPPAGHLA